MGWASGSELASEIVKAIKVEIPDAKRRKRIYKKIITAFENADCDTLDECEGEDPAFDAALKESQ